MYLDSDYYGFINAAGILSVPRLCAASNRLTLLIHLSIIHTHSHNTFSTGQKLDILQ